MLERVLSWAGVAWYEPGDPRSMRGRSPKWAALRDRFLKEHPACVVSGLRTQVEVHHVLPVSTHPELELEWENLRTVCRPYHFLFGHYGDWRDINPHFDRDAAHVRELVRDHRARWREAGHEPPPPPAGLAHALRVRLRGL